MQEFEINKKAGRANKLDALRRKLIAAGALGASALALSGIGSASQNIESLPRASSDRQDEAVGPQIKPIYIVPADGTDHQYDTNGVLESVLWKSQDWLASKAHGLSLRIDTYQGEPDIGFLKLKRTSADITQAGTGGVNLIQQELHAAGLSSNPNKILLAFYDGTQGSHPNQPGLLCGAGHWPPKTPGNTATANLDPRCGFNPNSEDFSYLDLVIPHEIFHTIGAVPESAPTYDGNAHTTDAADMMYAKQQPTLQQVENLQVDPAKDDYWSMVIPYLHDNHPNLAIDLSGEGSVSSSTPPNHYFSGPACEDDCIMVFQRGEQTTLQAFPDRFWQLKEWSGNGHIQGKELNLVMNSDQNVSAAFEPTAEIDIKLRKPGLGIVQAIGQGVCRASCKYEIVAGTRADLVAKPAKNARFVRWVGGCGLKPRCTFPATQGLHKRTAVFAKN